MLYLCIEQKTRDMKKLVIMTLLLGASMTMTMNAQTTNEKMTAMPPVENLQLTQE